MTCVCGDVSSIHADTFPHQCMWPGCDCPKYTDVSGNPTVSTHSPAAHNIDHPAHYTNTGVNCPGCGQPIETINITEQLSFNLGNIIKYVLRAGKKTDNPADDLQKARWYLDRQIQNQDSRNA